MLLPHEVTIGASKSRIKIVEEHDEVCMLLLSLAVHTIVEVPRANVRSNEMVGLMELMFVLEYTLVPPRVQVSDWITAFAPVPLALALVSREMAKETTAEFAPGSVPKTA